MKTLLAFHNNPELKEERQKLEVKNPGDFDPFSEEELAAEVTA